MNHRDMCKTWEEERVEVFRVSWARNNASGKDIANFVAFVRHQVQYYPYVHPAIGLLVAKELCPEVTDFRGRHWEDRKAEGRRHRQ